MVVNPVGFGTKSHCTSAGQQQFSSESNFTVFEAVVVEAWGSFVCGGGGGAQTHPYVNPIHEAVKISFVVCRLQGTLQRLQLSFRCFMVSGLYKLWQ
jgi:hypothetical protein